MLSSDQVQSVNKRLQTLFQLAGPASKDELLRRVSEDLTRIEQSLSAALASHARDVIRAESHILISVAGTIGASDLSNAACRLNSLALESGPLCAELANGILRDLAALRAFLAADHPPVPPPQPGKQT